MNRIVSLVILNATVGLILKIFQGYSPIFSMYYELKNQISFVNDFYAKSIRTCHTDFYCNTIDTFGKFLFLVNLTIPFFFYYKYDKRFHDCFYNLVESFRNYLKKQKKKHWIWVIKFLYIINYFFYVYYILWVCTHNTFFAIITYFFFQLDLNIRLTKKSLMIFHLFIY